MEYLKTLKKLSKNQRLLDRLRDLGLRKGTFKTRNHRNKSKNHSINFTSWRATNEWIDNEVLNGLNVTFIKKKRVIINLPDKMNFAGFYEQTVLYLIAIRKLVYRDNAPKKAYKLASVNFDNLKSISTSAALVLTAELSRWDDTISKNLIPNISNWDPSIVKQLNELGFFDLFRTPPGLSSISGSNGLSLVKYIKGQCTDKNKPKELKKSIQELVGDNISKWTFLHSGLTEAITNVSHHAYPKSLKMSSDDKNWYLTGSFDASSKELKIAFYDQGIGIPRSLPASEVWEKVLSFLSPLPKMEKKLHATLLKAAVQIDRTSTEDTDRGKGLPDLLEFIKQRKNGYLSILSLKGLYKYTISNGKERIKTFPFENELPGTLIIWSVNLK
jgi:hypothetical protein